MSLTFWKPGTVGPGSTFDRASELEETIVPYAPSNSYLSIQSQQERLPIFKHRCGSLLYSYHWSDPYLQVKSYCIVLKNMVLL